MPWTSTWRWSTVCVTQAEPGKQGVPDMGKRLTRIYTRTGDQGDTGLGDGARVPKDDPRIGAIGDIDETNSVLGILLTDTLPAALREILTRIQHELFDLGGELSLPGQAILDAGHVARLEADLDAINAQLPPLQEFILPGGTPAAAHCHLARSICRRAERSVYHLSRQETVNPHALAYLNRLSDLLFVAARSLCRSTGVEDVYWRSARLRGYDKQD